jgi:serine/threonine-protein kinase RIO1
MDASVEALLSAFGGPEKPCKQRAQHHYSAQNYQTRIKPKFDAEFARLKAAWEAGEGPQPHAVDVRNRVTAELWNGESEDVRARIEAEVQQDFEEEMAEYQEAVDRAEEEADGRTPQEYDR